MSATDIYRIAFIEDATKAYALQTERMEQLERLCRDMYENLEKWELPPNSYLTKRMIDLGLLDGE